MVTKERYMKYSRTLELRIPIALANDEHTPNTDFSIKFLISSCILDLLS